MTKHLGAHLSIAKGLHSVQDQMNLLNCDACALFLKNQRRFESTDLSQDAVDRFRQSVKRPDLILPHGSYLINLASPTSLEKSMPCLVDDLQRCHRLGLRLYNVHPGSDTTHLGIERATAHIADALNRAMKAVPDVIICIENMAGQGNTVGRTFSELKMIIEGVTDKTRIGITLDTCHLFAGGHDIRTGSGFERVMKEFKETVGLEYLKGVHLNDSKFDLGSRKDQHACLGEGKIGLEAFKYVMRSEDFEGVPMVLETPSPERFSEEIALLRSFELEIK